MIFFFMSIFTNSSNQLLTMFNIIDYGIYNNIWSSRLALINICLRFISSLDHINNRWSKAKAATNYCNSY